MTEQTIVICKEIRKELKSLTDMQRHDKLFFLTDATTAHHCLPLLAKDVPVAEHICIPQGDIHKGLNTLAHVWAELTDKGATRRSLLVNVGGGMVTDLGGFAAASFKRGIRCINIPTTLLGMVDAAVGGKTGINFGGLKNQIGAFHPATAVLIDSSFLQTLDMPNLFSGYAEMIKHGLISDVEHWRDLMLYDWNTKDLQSLQTLIAYSIDVKQRIVKQDPYERNIRKSLNLGHTIGHAFESMALERGEPVLHGYAVAWGLVCELYLSHVECGLSSEVLYQTTRFVKEHYGTSHLSCKDYERMYALMTQDKKNQSVENVNFTLLSGIGNVCIDQIPGKQKIYEAFDFYSEAMG